MNGQQISFQKKWQVHSFWYNAIKNILGSNKHGCFCKATKVFVFFSMEEGISCNELVWNISNVVPFLRKPISILWEDTHKHMRIKYDLVSAWNMFFVTVFLCLIGSVYRKISNIYLVSSNFPTNLVLRNFHVE